MKILAIDTSCDETSAAVTEGTSVLSNIVWSQAAAHAKFGGVMPSLAKRMHEERIDWVIKKAINNSQLTINNLDAVAVTVGPGLSIALGVGIDRAKKLATKFKKPLIAVNHLEGHLLSSLAQPVNHLSNQPINYPALGLVISGGNTVLVKINRIGSYETLAQTSDDALGEALDKSARMLGLGYPGGAVLEKMAKLGDATKFALPVPIAGQEQRQIFTYSGLKTAMMREVAKKESLSKEDVYNLSATFQNAAFRHIERVLDFIFKKYGFKNTTLLVGGGVSANVEIRKRLRKVCKKYSISVLFPGSKKLYGDNAAMVGIAAYLNPNFVDPENIDREPNLKLD